MSSAGAGGVSPTSTLASSTPSPTSAPLSEHTSTPGLPTTTTTPGVPVVVTSVTAPTAPASTQLITSIVTQSATVGNSQSGVTVVVVTSTSPGNANQGTSVPTSSTTSASTSTSAASAGSSSGLSPAGKTAIAVVIPIVAVAALILAAIVLYRRRSRRRMDEEKRTEEMAAYAYNPNNDPTLPAVGIKDDGMSDEAGGGTGGYRGWGPAGSGAAVGLGRKTSTNASGGTTVYGGAQSAPSPREGAVEVEGDMYRRNGTMDSDTMGPLGHRHELAATGAAAGAGAAGGAAAGGGLHRGPSNASSTYSHGEDPRTSNDYPIPYSTTGAGSLQPQDYHPYDDGMYYQPGPYDAYGQPGASGQPVIRDNPARRLTQIQEGSVHPQHGGISRNF